MTAALGFLAASVAGVARGVVGLRKEAGFVVIPAADSGAAAALLPHVGGDGEVAVDPGAGVFSQQGDVVQGIEFRGCGDLRARCGTQPRETRPVVAGADWAGSVAGLLARGGRTAARSVPEDGGAAASGCAR